jgi:hypothetical protein
VKTFPLGAGLRRLGRSPAMARWLDEESRQKHVALLHNHGLWMMPNVYPGRVAKRYGMPYIVSLRGTMIEESLPEYDCVFDTKRFWEVI